MRAARALGLDVRGTSDAWAAFSQNGLYRYVLGRSWAPPKTIARLALFILHNPSQAAIEDDPTSRKCIGFSRRWGMTGCLIINPFAIIATDPRSVVAAFKNKGDIVGGPLNAQMRSLALSDPSVALVVAGWGKLRVKDWSETTRSICFEVGKAMHELRCVDLNADGSPQHPLFVRYGDHLPFYSGNVAASLGMTGARS